MWCSIFKMVKALKRIYLFALMLMWATTRWKSMLGVLKKWEITPREVVKIFAFWIWGYDDKELRFVYLPFVVLIRVQKSETNHFFNSKVWHNPLRWSLPANKKWWLGFYSDFLEHCNEKKTYFVDKWCAAPLSDIYDFWIMISFGNG